MKALHLHSALMLTTALCAPLLAGCDRQDKNVPTLSMGYPGAAAVHNGTPASANQGADQGADAGSAARLDDTMAAPAAGLDVVPSLTAAEQQFVRQTIASSLYEIEAATIAMERASLAAVKQFAERLRVDHQLAHDRLRVMVGAGADIPTRVPEDKLAAIDALKQSGDATFDEQFLETVGIKDHEQAIVRFETAHKDIRNTALKGFVQDTLPTLKHHLSVARDMRSTRKDQN